MTYENFIPPRSKVVLEVTGKVADFETSRRKFLEIQPDCQYFLAENFPEVDKKFDTIILQSELIGNLKTNELSALIQRVGKKLNPRGTIIFTLDNLAFAENIMAILKGEPLKFKTTLTVNELKSSVQAAGANVSRSVNVAHQVAVPKNLAEISEVNISILKYIVSATLEKLPPKTLIQSVTGESIICAPIRVHMPNSFIMTEPNFFTVSNKTGEPTNLNSDNKYQNKIFIYQRMTLPTFNDGVKLFEQLKEHNYLYINETDDSPTRWQSDYERNGHIDFIGCHAIQTSTNYLANYFRQFNPHVRVFANQLKKIQPPRNFDEEFKQPNRPVTIFFGALNRDKDFENILPVVNEAARVYGDKLFFKVVANLELYNSIKTEHKILLGNPNYYNGQYIPYEEYEQALHTSDIALLPLLDNEFNRSKSDLKFIECASGGAVVLASPVVYAQVIKDGETGFLFRDLKEFAKKFEFLIRNRDARRKLAENAYNYVKHNRLMSQHYEERIDWYRELLARLPELNRETQQRIEKIAPKFANEIFWE